MKLHHPFGISPLLLPGLKINDAWLSLVRVESDILEPQRHRAVFRLDIPGLDTYHDDSLRSGYGGFRSTVEPFESYLAFLEACIESRRWEQWNPGSKGDNSDLFTPHVADWAVDNSNEIECLRMDMTEHEQGHVLHHLIEG